MLDIDYKKIRAEAEQQFQNSEYAKEQIKAYILGYAHAWIAEQIAEPSPTLPPSTFPTPHPWAGLIRDIAKALAAPKVIAAWPVIRRALQYIPFLSTTNNYLITPIVDTIAEKYHSIFAFYVARKVISSLLPDSWSKVKRDLGLVGLSLTVAATTNISETITEYCSPLYVAPTLVFLYHQKQNIINSAVETAERLESITELNICWS